MARIEIRLITSPRDASAFAEFLAKVAESVPSAMAIISKGYNRRSRNGTDVLRYMEIEFNTDDFEQSGLKR